MEKLCDCGCGKLVTRSPSLMKSRVYFSQICYQNAQRKQSLTSRVCAKCVLSNVVPCCGRCNFIKGSYFTYDEMIECLAPGLFQIRIKRG